MRIPYEGSAELVTLDDPSDGSESAQNAFARLRPPPDHSPAETASWRERVAKVALAVRVMPAERSALVPLASARPEISPVRSFREEATALAKETGDPELQEMVTMILDRVKA